MTERQTFYLQVSVRKTLAERQHGSLMDMGRENQNNILAETEIQESVGRGVLLDTLRLYFLEKLSRSPVLYLRYANLSVLLAFCVSSGPPGMHPYFAIYTLHQSSLCLLDNDQPGREARRHIV